MGKSFGCCYSLAGGCGPPVNTWSRWLVAIVMHSPMKERRLAVYLRAIKVHSDCWTNPSSKKKRYGQYRYVDFELLLFAGDQSILSMC